MELIILKALKWELCPVTIISWLNFYLQVTSLKKEVSNVLLPQYSQDTFVQIAQLLDLCILDDESLDYQYGVLAAAALYHFTSFEVVLKASGLDWDCISDCVSWMVPFAQTVREQPPAKLKDFRNISLEDGHNIQTHINYMDLLAEVQNKPAACLSPVSVGGILTPPKSTEKPSHSKKH
nr:PREDICTED: G1/S-specific cyclin-E2-like [Latimeria chalumnae]|eukprot:XP_014347158.1 PREDICTED: G1/S-specific cyclin-E2-like [Latimeria chalumnae]